MIKAFGRWLALLAMLAIPVGASASTCQVGDAVVTFLTQWEDGHIFIQVDKPLLCGCAIDVRAAFHNTDPNQKFFVNAAIMAFATGKKVSLRADNINNTCPIHGNTAKLLSLTVANQWKGGAQRMRFSECHEGQTPFISFTERP